MRLPCSGEYDGTHTSSPVDGSVTEVSTKNSAASRMTGYARLAEKHAVAGEKKPLPQMLAEPSATGRPYTVNVVHRCGAAPEIGVVVHHPTARSSIRVWAVRLPLTTTSSMRSNIASCVSLSAVSSAGQ